MTDEEFKSQFTRPGEVLLDCIPDDWGWDSKWVASNKVNHYLGFLGSNKELYYESKVPNPGCLNCGSRVGFDNQRFQWNTYCSKSCQAQHKWLDSDYRNLMTEVGRSVMTSNWNNKDWIESRRLSNELLWSDPEYRQYMSELMSERVSEFWNDPVFRMNHYLNICASRGITLALVYLVKYVDTVKCGITCDINRRLKELGHPEILCLSSIMEVSKAAQLECDIHSKFSNYNNFELYGCHETYPAELEDRILECIK